MTRAFVYKWTELSTGKWYIGSRTAKNCHPDDGYICSSKIVKPLIKADPDNWVRQVLCIGHPKDMYELECKLLSSLDAAADEMSYNKSNGGVNFGAAGKNMSEETRQKIREARLGTKRSDETCKRIGAASRNRLHPPRTTEARKKISDKLIGVPKTEEHRKKISEIQSTLPKKTCEHCGFVASPSKIARWHNDNCRHKPPKQDI